MCDFHTEICNLIKNYVHQGENNPRQEVSDGYIFVNIFIKNLTISLIIILYYNMNQAWLLDQYFYGTYQQNRILSKWYNTA